MNGLPPFHLGLTMAGAVSAGAYTGGVMDYLFEALDKWERAKACKSEDDLPEDLKGIDLSLVPQHKVIINAMGGNSAGGMTTIMSALYAIQNEIKPVTTPPTEDLLKKRDNIFWDSWIILDDDVNKKTLMKALSSDDLKKVKKILSGLNSDFIDSIGSRAFSLPEPKDKNPASKVPAYFSKDLEVLISHAMIQGIPLAVAFESGRAGLKTAPSHSTYEHQLFSHFRLYEGKEVDPEKYIWLNPYHPGSKTHLTKAAIATGAFPIGLRFREFDLNDFNPEYLKNVLSRVIEGKMYEEVPEIKDKIDWDNCTLDKYLTNSVDGGAINNEPYGEVQSLITRGQDEKGFVIQARKYNESLKEEYTKKEIKQYQATYPKDLETEHDSYQMKGMVMIDPFPDFYEQRGEYKHAEDLFGVIPGIISTLWDQSKIKRREMKVQFDSKLFRGTIFPVKYGTDGKKLKHPIACGSLEAFGGFLDINFRVHDYFLGRNNARTYLRSYFSVPYYPEKGIVHPLHRDPYWTQDMRKRFLIKFPDGTQFLPLIPDMNMLKDGYTSKDQAMVYDIPELPQITKKDIAIIKKPLNTRVKEMAKLILFGKSKSKSDKVWWKRILHWGWKILAFVFAIPVLLWTLPVVLRMPGRKVVKIVLENLKMRGLLKEK